MEKTSPQDTYLQMLLTCILLQEQCDLLKNTNVYRHELKQAAKRLEKELNKVTGGDVDLIVGINDNALYHQMDYQKDLIREIASIKAEDNGIIAKIIQQYKKYPDEILEACKIKLVDTIEK